MNETPLTQEVIDGHPTESSTSHGLFSKAARHPFVTAGALLAGAGLAYAAVKTIQRTSHRLTLSDAPNGYETFRNNQNECTKVA
jgi:threonine dehydrogenase-like Zn-dependent dehydrogenase